MAFSQLFYRKSLPEIESRLCAMQNKLYHGGTGSRVSNHVPHTKA
ncbi:MAG: DUF4372 domain-containing protein [Deltaproteobacteria bacterium]|nr:DUF4372 domain-containing protein [Deltaproteobacteria bacterium]